METDLENKTPREILGKFYSENHLEPDGGNSSSSVKIEITKNFHFYFPNFDARRKAVLRHDIHHLLTGYTTSLAEESAISAWEIASGCKKYRAAFFIDTSGMMIGIPIHFWGILKAFSRGRRTKNLYHDIISPTTALDMKIGELKKEFLLDKFPKDTKPTFIDFICFAGFSLFGLVFSIFSLVLLPIIIIYSIYIELKIRAKKN
jgi:hypothetical protein